MPEEILGTEIDKSVRRDLLTLSKETAARVSRHLVATGYLLDSNPERAYVHATFAARLAGRVGLVRETAGIAAHRTGHYAEAIRELRAAIRLTNDHTTLPLIADCERGLGRPERALELAKSSDAMLLDDEGRVELTIVESGARADMDDLEGAVVALQIPGLRERVGGNWQPRLWVAYADALSATGRDDEARKWLTLAADIDSAGVTNAAERLGRPAPVGDDEPWASDEVLELMDAFDDTADAELDPAAETAAQSEIGAGATTDGGPEVDATVGASAEADEAHEADADPNADAPRRDS